MIIVYPYENEKLVEEIKPLKGGYKHDAILPEGLAPIPVEGRSVMSHLKWLLNYFFGFVPKVSSWQRAVGKNKTIGYPHQKQKNLLYRHSCRPYRVSDVREQESVVSLNVNLFCVYWVFVSRLHRFLVTPSPTHKPQGMTREDVLRYGFGWI